MAENIKVMIVDESAVVRQVVTQALQEAPGIEVIATVSDPVLALDRMRLQWPDVLIVDIEMSRMDGIGFLRKIMAERPTPVVICSSLAGRGSKESCDALAVGVVAIISKPTVGLKSFLEEAAIDIRQAVRTAARANVRALAVEAGAAVKCFPEKPGMAFSPGPRLSRASMPDHPAGLERTTDQVIAIGTSTGGTQALEAILTRLPPTCLGIVIVQHMPTMFTAMFSERLNPLCQIEVREAQNGDQVLPGRALIAPGGKHMTLKRNGAQYVVEVSDGPLFNRHKPSVDILFRSVARIAGANALGIILTGMGDDGARGLKEMRDTGARTLAQDEASCVVFGMPKEAIKLGAAEHVVPLEHIPAAIVSYSSQLLKG